MFWNVCDPSSGSTELCLTEITRGGSQILFVCLVGVWQSNFEPAVSAHNTTSSQPVVVMLYYGIMFVSLVVSKNRKCNDYYLPCHYHQK